MKKIIAFVYLVLCLIASSQTLAGSGEIIRGNAKFNVVILVLSIIFCGIVFFLFRMDRRLQKLEKNNAEKG
ncbi:MAG: CcmD family protein [Bacteroidetes bacterium]|nr:CcmD family protein [Bacteroidota bacterium]